MDSSDFRIIYLFTDLLAPLAAGYLLYQRGYISDALISRILRLNVIVIYTILALMSCWTLPISWDLALIPLYGILIVLVPGLIGWAFFIRKYHNPLDRGAYLANAMMSNITTLGGVCAFILYGEQGFAYAQIMGIFQTVMLVLAVFPMAQYYYLQHKNHGAGGKIRMDIRGILLSWNQLSILGMAAGLTLNALGIARPPAVGTAFEGLIHFGAWFGMLPVGALVHLRRARRYAPYTLDLFALRFLILPAFMMAVSYPLVGDPVLLGAILVFSVTPGAINSVTAAKLYHLNVDYTISGFLTTSIAFFFVVYPALFFLLR
ncbi:transporter [uncultured Selenomonas sp.]|uniref:AEC family transporter n=1 Tax=uncultured Selenomonas sp. TaxID=159275 RepID=UPI0028D64620|nr:transporter [uncultured Selenomonas sp.]